MSTIMAGRILDLGELANGWDIVDFSVGPAHDPLMLMRKRRTAAAAASSERRGLGEAQPWLFRLIHRIGDRTTVVDMQQSQRNYVRAHLLGNALYVVFSSGGKDESIADVFRSNGKVVRSLSIGHGITAMEISATGRIWVGYADNGAVVYGRIACFDHEGNHLLRFDDLADAYGIGTAFDCYALNVVSDEETWVYYIDDRFWLVRLEGMEIAEYWSDLPIRSSFAFAVAGRRVLFHGGYHDRGLTQKFGRGYTNDRFHLVDLDSRQFRELFPVDGNGKLLNPSNAFGRGERLYFDTESVLHVVDVSSLTF